METRILKGELFQRIFAGITLHRVVGDHHRLDRGYLTRRGIRIFLRVASGRTNPPHAEIEEHPKKLDRLLAAPNVEELE